MDGNGTSEIYDVIEQMRPKLLEAYKAKCKENPKWFDKQFAGADSKYLGGRADKTRYLPDNLDIVFPRTMYATAFDETIHRINWSYKTKELRKNSRVATRVGYGVITGINADGTFEVKLDNGNKRLPKVAKYDLKLLRTLTQDPKDPNVIRHETVMLKHYSHDDSDDNKSGCDPHVDLITVRNDLYAIPFPLSIVIKPGKSALGCYTEDGKRQLTVPDLVEDTRVQIIDEDDVHFGKLGEITEVEEEKFTVKLDDEEDPQEYTEGQIESLAEVGAATFITPEVKHFVDPLEKDDERIVLIVFGELRFEKSEEHSEQLQEENNRDWRELEQYMQDLLKKPMELLSEEDHADIREWRKMEEGRQEEVDVSNNSKDDEDEITAGDCQSATASVS